jgi:hypothetical protein
MGDGGSTEQRSPVARFLALNRTVCVVLATILCFGMGEQLWEPLMPNHFQDQSKVEAGEAAGSCLPLAVLLTVGLYSLRG